MVGIQGPGRAGSVVTSIVSGARQSLRNLPLSFAGHDVGSGTVLDPANQQAFLGERLSHCSFLSTKLQRASSFGIAPL